MFTRLLPSNFWQSPWRWGLLAAVYLIGLGRYSVPWTGDQKFYLNVALEMRETGSWVIPRFLGEPNYIKPPFQYWATWLGLDALGDALGFSLWGALVPSVLAALFTAWLLSRITRLPQTRSAEKGFDPATVFLLSLGTLTYGTVAQMEIYVCLFHAAAWYAGLRSVEHPDLKSLRSGWLVLAFLIAGAAACVKSPIYSAFWVLGFVFYLWSSKRVGLLKRPVFWVALSLGVAIGLAWFAAVMKLDAARFWSEYVERETLGKGSNAGTVASLWYALLYFCFPFTLLILFAVRELVHEKGRDFRAFFLGWVFPPALFFSLHPYRVKTYLYILVPVLCLALARVPRERFPKWVRVTSAFVPAAFLAVLAVVLGRSGLVPGSVILGLVLAGALLLGIAVPARSQGHRSEEVRAGGYRDGWFLAGAALALLSVRLAAISLGEQDIAALRSLVREHSGAQIALWDGQRNIWNEAGLLSLALGRKIERLQTREQAEAAAAAGTWVGLPEETAGEWGWLAADTPYTTREWPRWKARVRFPFRELVTEGESALGPGRERLIRRFWLMRRDTRDR